MAKAKTGPKSKHVADKIDKEDVIKLATMQCTMIEMADFLGCSVDTLERNFADSIKVGRSRGCISMKRKLYEKGMGGDLGAIIWWQKNFSGMSDRMEQKQEITFSNLSNEEIDARIKELEAKNGRAT